MTTATAPTPTPLAFRKSLFNWDGIFALATKGSALTIAIVLALVALFLTMLAWPALVDPSLRLPMRGRVEPVSIWEYVAPQLYGTALAAAVALALAVPVAMALAVFINFYAPRALAGPLAALIDVMVAIPSVVYGLWGGLVLLPLLQPFMEFLAKYFGWIPLFAGPVSPIGRVIFSASIVLAIMVVPIITAICREIYARAPHLQMEASLALGATKWEMIKMVVLPFGRSGTVSAAMIGLGRALGETMAVAMVLSPGATFSLSLLHASAHSTIASNIALQYPEATPKMASALIFTGLVLFLITLAVNAGGRAFVARKEK
ncbi:MAG: phosphate ABC transporter permease subunit PstC [Actinomycetaceae bacterium]|nr:phosphate ABC transporter permease subunit PstC [Actinomycetaceae bacterium]